jgi:hypothetical protein
MASEQVTRYDMKGDWCEHRVANGDWVRYDDYETLLARCERAEATVAACQKAEFVGQTADGVRVRLGDPVYHPDLNHDLCQDHFRASWGGTVVSKFGGAIRSDEHTGNVECWYSTRTAAEAARGGEQNA